MSSPKARFVSAVAFGLAALSAALLYWPSLEYPFLRWDDPVYVTGRAALQKLAAGQDAWWSLLSPRAAWEGKVWEYFPFRDLTYGLDAWRSGMQAEAFHQTQLGLHLLTTLWVFLLARSFGLGAMAAGLATALFGLHPVAVEPVAWISGRKDLLYSAATLAALWVFLRLLSEPRRLGLWLLVYLLALLSFASKGPGVIVVALLLLWACRSERPQALWLRLAPLAAIAAAWTYLVLQIGARNAIVSGSTDGLLGGLFRALGAPVRALSHMLFPIALSPSYGGWGAAWWRDPHSWSTVALALLGILFWSRRRSQMPAAEAPPERGSPPGASADAPDSGPPPSQREPVWRRLPFLGACSFGLALLPTSGIIAVNQPQADRFYYLALAWFALAMAWLVQRLSRRWLWPLALAAVLLGAWKSHHYLKAWAGDLPLWKAVYRQDPSHPVASLQLALLAMERKQRALAYKLLSRALQKHPKMPALWLNLGVWWHTEARRATGASQSAARARARSAYLKTLSLQPASPVAHNGLALLARAAQQPSRAEFHFRKALQAPQAPLVVALNYARWLWSQNRKKEATMLIRRRSQRHPRFLPYALWLKAPTP